MKKRKWQGKIIAELLKNYEKREPRCRHFMRCGGCSMQDFGYDDQLKGKAGKLRELFGDLTTNINVTCRGDREYGYRTRMDYVVSTGGLGLRRKRRFDEVVDLEECFLIDNEIFLFLKEIYNTGLKLGLVPYDLKSHEGFWRYISVRVNDRREFMVILNTKSDVDLFPVLDRLVEGIVNEKIKPVSIYHIINDGLADTNFGSIRKFWGDEYLGFDIGNMDIRIGPNTFFQNNIELLNGLIAKLLEYINDDDWVLDLYCGVGTLSLPIAKKCKEVLGIELVEESIELARLNADNNNIDNVVFEVGDVGKVIAKLGGESLKHNVLLLDPPRKGLEKTAVELLKFDFEKIIYMSCNPITLKKDLEVLLEKYEIVEISWWDLYPQTPHVEGLVFLQKN
ncbi:23S rRNA (uracil(1939)-C(5))-methyltransferase RlmD [Patescibacteria group bacterium]|nr:23S rRNA (uracil(1939)-C(5))-methyltransferase RlmD [Patescibacteria group bacterium]